MFNIEPVKRTCIQLKMKKHFIKIIKISQLPYMWTRKKLSEKIEHIKKNPLPYMCQHHKEKIIIII